MWVTLILLEDASRTGLWATWIVVSLLGLYSGYAYVMIVAVQIVYLGIYHHRCLSWWLSCLLVIGGALPLASFAFSSLGRVAFQHANTEPLTLGRTLQTLFAGEPGRYGSSPAHMIFPAAAMGLLAVSIIVAARRPDRGLSYVTLQAVAPMGLFFLVSQWLELRLPLPEAKQFVLLLPAWLVLFGVGVTAIARLAQHADRNYRLALATLITGGMISLNLISLRTYWSTPKSPEGLTVRSVQVGLEEGEPIVSLHYSITHALYFYVPDAIVYLDPKEEEGIYKYRRVNSRELFARVMTAGHVTDTEQIRSHHRFWIMGTSGITDQPSFTSLVAGCTILEQENYLAYHGSFLAVHVECAES